MVLKSEKKIKVKMCVSAILLQKLKLFEIILYLTRFTMKLV